MISSSFRGYEGGISEGRRAMACSHFDSLVGAEVDYYGADSGDHTFKVDGIVFKVLEDPDDGYRSHFGTIDYTVEHSSIFFHAPVARVIIIAADGDRIDDEGDDSGWKLIDRDDGHVWLEFGTNHTDSYYPYFYFRHMAKEPK